MRSFRCWPLMAPRKVASGARVQGRSNEIASRQSDHPGVPASGHLDRGMRTSPTRRPIKEWGYFTVALTVLGLRPLGKYSADIGCHRRNRSFRNHRPEQTVQHLEGGVIKDILVREGDIVEPGQMLVRLDDTTPRAELRRLALRNALNTAKVARYTAEIQGDAEIDVPTDIVPKSAGIDIRDIDEIIDTQKLAFEARRKNVQTQIAALDNFITRCRSGWTQEACRRCPRSSKSI